MIADWLPRYTAWLVIVLGCALLLAGCMVLATPATPPDRSAVPSGPLTVMAAASLAGAFTEIGQTFEAAHPNVDVQFNFAGSQQLTLQLAQGAPADVFASADTPQMTAAIAAGRVVTGTPRTLVTNRLVIALPANNPANLKDIGDLARPGVKLLMADPAVPVGHYTLTFFDLANQSGAYGSHFAELARQNVVSYEENVKAVLSKVLLGEVDAGIVYTSDVTGDTAQHVGVIEIPEALNVVAQYFIAPVGDSRQPALAQAFIDLTTSAEGQTILARYGFMPPPAPPAP